MPYWEIMFLPKLMLSNIDPAVIKLSSSVRDLPAVVKENVLLWLPAMAFQFHYSWNSVELLTGNTIVALHKPVEQRGKVTHRIKHSAANEIIVFRKK